MTLFEILDNIISKKRVLKASQLKDCDAFIIQRYLSFIGNKGLVLILNKFINSNKTLFTDSERFHNTCLSLVPKMSSRYINYIKKEKKKKDDHEKIKQYVCKHHRLSRKELDAYLEIDSSLINEYKKIFDIFEGHKKL